MTSHWSITRVSGFRNAEWSQCFYWRPHNPLLTALTLAHPNIALAHRLLSKRENACSLKEERPVNMHAQGLQVSFSCNFRIIYLIKLVWSWFACLFSLTLTAGKNSSKASSSSNVDSVVGCWHISNFNQRLLSHTSKRKQGLSKLYCLLWTSKLVFNPRVVKFLDEANQVSCYIVNSLGMWE